MSKHYKSVFENEQELLKAILEIHINKETFDCDPMFYKGNFYKQIPKPKLVFDLNPQFDYVIQSDVKKLPVPNNSLESIILDPPFLFGVHGKTKDYYSSKTHTMFNTFIELETTYKLMLNEAYRVLKNKGKVIFKCQDYTDSKTTMTHALVYNWALEKGFYAKDLCILVKPLKIYNGNLNQRHFRKIHTYFWIFEK
jgi:DNA modification methylase